jgi:acyl carrier protein
MSDNQVYNEYEIKDIISQFILKNFVFDDQNKNIDENLSLYEKGIIDSTGVLELVDFLEEKFEIKIEDEELIPDNLDSIIKIINFIQRKKGNAG